MKRYVFFIGILTCFLPTQYSFAQEQVKFKLSVDQVGKLLVREIPNFDGPDTNFKRPDDTTNERKAIAQVREDKIQVLIPEVVNFVDYAASSFQSDTSLQNESYTEEAEASWPAFKTLRAFPEQSGKALENAINSTKGNVRLRLTWLQILREISPDKAKLVGQKLQREMSELGQVGAADRVEKILAGNLRYWGLINFRPITMTKEQVISFLAPSRYIPNQSVLIVSRKVEDKESISLINSQLEALYNAGELKSVDLVPILVNYMNYVRGGDQGFFSTTSLNIESRRKKRPALDALLKIGKAGSDVLVRYVLDKSNITVNRVNALSVLREIDYELAVKTGQQLITAPEIEKDDVNLKRAKLLMKKKLQFSDFVRPISP
jgi:hypothetical protein